MQQESELKRIPESLLSPKKSREKQKWAGPGAEQGGGGTLLALHTTFSRIPVSNSTFGDGAGHPFPGKGLLRPLCLQR